MNERDNLISLIKSKFFLIGIIALLLITSASFYLLKEKEKNLRIYTQEQLTKTTNELTFEKERVLELKNEVENKKRQVKLTLDKLEREIAARHKTEAQLITALEEKRILETKIKGLTEIPDTIELEKIVIKSASPLAGKILKVNRENAFIVTNLGRKDNLKIGTILSVYRDDSFIGNVQVEQVRDDVCAASILPFWQGVEFKENDEVKGL